MLPQKNNPLHNITLEQIMNYLVETCGWQYLAEQININCFQNNPTIKSSLTLVRAHGVLRKKVKLDFMVGLF